VFEGGVGMLRGGMVERSRDIGVRDSLEDGREERGELSVDIFAVCLRISRIIGVENIQRNLVIVDFVSLEAVGSGGNLNGFIHSWRC
jgi:hypothetical protein